MDWTQAFHEVTPVEQLEGRSVRRAQVTPTPWFNEGRRDQKVAFVFAAPGRSEADWQMPAAGDTGLTLNLLLAFLHRARPTLFPKLERYDYRIVNASSRFHYEGLTLSTTPGKREIKALANLDRFKRDLVTMELVLCMGDHAWLACQEAYNIREPLSAPPPDIHRLACPVIRIGQRIFVKSQHLSAQRLNTLFKVRAIRPQIRELVPDQPKPKPWHFAKYRTLIVARAIIAALDFAETRWPQAGV